MKHCICLIVAVACSKSADAPSSGAASGTPSTTPGKSSSLANAVAVLTDACPLLPKATVARLVPNGGAPQGQRYPLSCSVYGKPSGIAITFDNGPAPSGHDVELGQGTAMTSMLERLDPKDKGDVYLTISLGTDGNGNNHNLHIAVSGHDGVDHKDDAIGLAREVIANIK